MQVINSNEAHYLPRIQAHHDKRQRLASSRQPLRKSLRLLNQVIWVDHLSMIAEVEGFTTYDTLLSATLSFDCLPAVVPKSKFVTIADALSGAMVGPASFRYGMAHETIVEYDVLLQNGQVITCRPDNEHKDLFYTFPNSHGALGHVLRVVLTLKPATSHVSLVQSTFTNPASFFDTLKALSLEQHQSGDIAFIQGQILGKNEMRTLVARFSDLPAITTRDFLWRKKKWFKHPIRSWVSRLDRGVEQLHKRVFIPSENAAHFLQFLGQHFYFWPVTCLPSISFDEQVPYDLIPLSPNQLYLNFRFYRKVLSMKPKGHYNHLIEEKVKALGGFIPSSRHQDALLETYNAVKEKYDAYQP